MKKITYIIIALMFTITIAKAQSIPNAGFENWTNMGTYENIDSWSCLNNMTAGFSTYTCNKGTPGTSGNSCLKLTSKTINSLVVPGIAVCGKINTTTFQPESGFPCTGRPKNLTGKWQHMIYGSSQGFIDVKLTRWDNNTKTRIPVASAHYDLVGMAMSWASFIVPITYMDNNAPDTCIIVLSASGTTPANNDYLWVDNLAFTGNVSGIREIRSTTNISIFPNPSHSNIRIDLTPLKSQISSIQILDIQGKLVKTIDANSAALKSYLDIDDLPMGNYLLKIIAQEGTITKKFIIE